MQMLLVRETLRPLQERRPDSLSSLVREIRGLIKDQRDIVEKAPIGLSSDGAKHQVRDILERHALLAAELRRKGLGSLLDSITGAAVVKAELPAGVRELMAEAGAAEAEGAEAEKGEGGTGV